MNEIRVGAAMSPPAPTVREAKGTSDFGALLRDAVQEVNRLQSEADQATEGLMTGRQPSLHRTLVALEKADISFKLMMKVRDKIVDAYREIMRMSV
jgi:flagellar hook-basal body complex protein FliE